MQKRFACTNSKCLRNVSGKSKRIFEDITNRNLCIVKKQRTKSNGKLIWKGVAGSTSLCSCEHNFSLLESVEAFVLSGVHVGGSCMAFPDQVTTAAEF